jgi:hypothetical protein
MWCEGDLDLMRLRIYNIYIYIYVSQYWLSQSTVSSLIKWYGGVRTYPWGWPLRINIIPKNTHNWEGSVIFSTLRFKSEKLAWRHRQRRSRSMHSRGMHTTIPRPRSKYRADALLPSLKSWCSTFTNLACLLTVPRDPYKTLLVARLSYDTTEKKLRREFEQYGPIKTIRWGAEETRSWGDA